MAVSASLTSSLSLLRLLLEDPLFLELLDFFLPLGFSSSSLSSSEADSLFSSLDSSFFAFLLALFLGDALFFGDFLPDGEADFLFGDLAFFGEADFFGDLDLEAGDLDLPFLGDLDVVFCFLGDGDLVFLAPLLADLFLPLSSS